MTLTGPDGAALDLGESRRARVTGVRTVGGNRWAAATVVLCTGASTGRLTGYPVHPVKGQILRLAVPPRLRTDRAVLRHTVRGLIKGSEIYLVPRADGEVVVGATQEQQGFDTSVTAGGVFELLRNAYELLPVSSEFEFIEARAGLRPGTPDNGPLLGSVLPVGVDRRRGDAAGHRPAGRAAVGAISPGSLRSGAPKGRGPDRCNSANRQRILMQLLVNGQPMTLDPGVTLAMLVPAISDRTTGIAAALNSEVVPRSRWPSTPLGSGDQVEIVTAVQGG